MATLEDLEAKITELEKQIFKINKIKRKEDLQTIKALISKHRFPASKLKDILNLRIQDQPIANIDILQKATSSSFLERFREIISDPLNILIERVPEAGYVDQDGFVVLHNGHKVPYSGEYSYYDEFSKIFVLNRGVHEPLEEYCFQEVLKKIKTKEPVMIELGAYWAHYSMWFKKVFHDASCIMVEPTENGLRSGQLNFQKNGYNGEFLQDKIAKNNLSVDHLFKERQFKKINLLHCDIQGSETDMLLGAEKSLRGHKIDYLFISTHGEGQHEDIINTLKDYKYRVEVSSPFAKHSTSFDGFILAVSPKIKTVFKSFTPLGRIEIAQSNSSQIVKSVCNIK